nr:flagellar basal body P-ring formation chaperone FlgA [uncultured Rhodopila sp.]
MRLLLALILTLAAAAAQAASLRSATTLHGQNVYLRDLFDDSGRNADRLLGPGPGPGERIIVEAAQLDAIARQYGVAWRSISSGDRAILEWPGQPLSADAVAVAVRAALAATGDSADYDIGLEDFAAPTVPSEGTPGLLVSRVEFDRNNGRFAALLSVTADGMKPMALRIGGRAEAMIEAPVSVGRLKQDAIVRAEDLRQGRVAAGPTERDVARSMDQIVGMQLVRPVGPGQKLLLSDLTRPVLVRKGALVQAELRAGSLSIAGQVMAVDAGGAGEVVRVQNVTSHLFLFARVVGLGRVIVAPDGAGAFQTIPARFEDKVTSR